MIDSKVAGNVLPAGSILFSGNSFQNVNSLAQRLNLTFIGKSVFYNIPKDILIPVVDKAWKDHQDSLLNEVKKLPKLDICGMDGVTVLDIVQSMGHIQLWMKIPTKYST